MNNVKVNVRLAKHRNALIVNKNLILAHNLKIINAQKHKLNMNL